MMQVLESSELEKLGVGGADLESLKSDYGCPAYVFEIQQCQDIGKLAEVEGAISNWEASADTISELLLPNGLN